MDILEAIVFKDCTPKAVYAPSIAPWIPPSCRGHVVNTEIFKLSSTHDSGSEPSGCPKTLASLIRKGIYNPLDLKSTSTKDLESICSLVGIKRKIASTKVYNKV